MGYDIVGCGFADVEYDEDEQYESVNSKSSGSKTIKKIVPLNIKYLKSPGCQPGSLLSSEENKIKKAAETAFLKPNLCEQAVSRVLPGTFVPE